MYVLGSPVDAYVPVPDRNLSLCPYRDAADAVCSAAIMTFTISKRQDAAYCRTENFDQCPLFLAKVLRGL